MTSNLCCLSQMTWHLNFWGRCKDSVRARQWIYGPILSVSTGLCGKRWFLGPHKTHGSQKHSVWVCPRKWVRVRLTKSWVCYRMEMSKSNKSEKGLNKSLRRLASLMPTSNVVDYQGLKNSKRATGKSSFLKKMVKGCRSLQRNSDKLSRNGKNQANTKSNWFLPKWSWASMRKSSRSSKWSPGRHLSWFMSRKNLLVRMPHTNWNLPLYIRWLQSSKWSSIPSLGSTSSTTDQSMVRNRRTWT